MPDNANGSSSSENSGGGKNSRIKLRSTAREAPVVDKAWDLAEKTKTASIRTKQNTQNVLDDSYSNETNYAQDRAGEGARQTAEDTKENAKKAGRKIKNETRRQIEKRLEKMDSKESSKSSSRSTEQGRIRTRDQARAKDIKTRQAAKQGSEPIKMTARSSGRATIKTAEHSVKGTGKTVRTAQSTSKAAAKTTKEGAQAAVKASEKAAIAAKNAAVSAARALESAARAVLSALKAAASAIGKYAAAAGAAIVGAAPFIALGCVIIAVAVLCTGDTARNSSGVSDSSVISDLNLAWKEQLSGLTSGFEDVTMEGGRATWPEIFSLYTAQSDETSVEDWDEKNDLSRIFWEMNWISYDVYTVAEAKAAPEVDVKTLLRSVDATFIYFNDGHVYKTETETYLNPKKPEEIATQYPDREIHPAITVTVKHRSVEEMMESLGFTKYQTEHVQALLEPQFLSFWQQRIYGVTGADDDIVNVAITQLGNSGGWPYWEYVGFDSRVEWCACFVSWCAAQCGYITDGLFIVTGSPPEQASFFKNNGHWMDGNATPSSGMIIFFDWYNADFADHVAIVEKVEDGLVHTIEGNADDSVMRLTWPLGDSQIMGYGWIVER